MLSLFALVALALTVLNTCAAYRLQTMGSTVNPWESWFQEIEAPFADGYKSSEMAQTIADTTTSTEHRASTPASSGSQPTEKPASRVNPWAKWFAELDGDAERSRKPQIKPTTLASTVDTVTTQGDYKSTDSATSFSTEHSTTAPASSGSQPTRKPASRVNPWAKWFAELDGDGKSSRKQQSKPTALASTVDTVTTQAGYQSTVEPQTKSATPAATVDPATTSAPYKPRYTEGPTFKTSTGLPLSTRMHTERTSAPYKPQYTKGPKFETGMKHPWSIQIHTKRTYAKYIPRRAKKLEVIPAYPSPSMDGNYVHNDPVDWILWMYLHFRYINTDPYTSRFRRYSRDRSAYSDPWWMPY